MREKISQTLKRKNMNQKRVMHGMNLPRKNSWKIGEEN